VQLLDFAFILFVDRLGVSRPSRLEFASALTFFSSRVHQDRSLFVKTNLLISSALDVVILRLPDSPEASSTALVEIFRNDRFYNIHAVLVRLDSSILSPIISVR